MKHCQHYVENELRPYRKHDFLRPHLAWLLPNSRFQLPNEQIDEQIVNALIALHELIGCVPIQYRGEIKHPHSVDLQHRPEIYGFDCELKHHELINWLRLHHFLLHLNYSPLIHELINEQINGLINERIHELNHEQIRGQTREQSLQLKHHGLRSLMQICGSQLPLIVLKPLDSTLPIVVPLVVLLHLVGHLHELTTSQI